MIQIGKIYSVDGMKGGKLHYAVVSSSDAFAVLRFDDYEGRPNMAVVVSIAALQSINAVETYLSDTCGVLLDDNEKMYSCKIYFPGNSPPADWLDCCDKHIGSVEWENVYGFDMPEEAAAEFAKDRSMSHGEIVEVKGKGLYQISTIEGYLAAKMS